MLHSVLNRNLNFQNGGFSNTSHAKFQSAKFRPTSSRSANAQSDHRKKRLRHCGKYGLANTLTKTSTRASA